MLNNITNFFNLIKTGKVKTQLDSTDLLPIGTRDLRFSGQYQPTMIKYGDFISGLVGGSNGQVLFNDNDTIAGASTFYWDKVNNRVGIGTSTPANTLDVNGTARVVGNTLLDSGIIATSSATTRLQGSLNYFSHNRLSSSGTYGFDIRQVGTTRSFWRYNDGSGNTEFGSNNYGIEFYGANAVRATLTAGGNLLINTTTDAGFTLDVNGTARVSGALTVSGNQILFSGSTTNTYITQNIGTGVGNFSAATCVQFQVNTFPKIIVRDTGSSRASTLIVGDNVATTESAHSSALLEVRSSSSYIKGFLPPRMTTTEKNAIATPAAGLMVYDNTLNRPCFYNGTSWITL